MQMLIDTQGSGDWGAKAQQLGSGRSGGACKMYNVRALKHNQTLEGQKLGGVQVQPRQQGREPDVDTNTKLNIGDRIGVDYNEGTKRITYWGVVAEISGLNLLRIKFDGDNDVTSETIDVAVHPCYLGKKAAETETAGNDNEPDPFWDSDAEDERRYGDYLKSEEAIKAAQQQIAGRQKGERKARWTHRHKRLRGGE